MLSDMNTHQPMVLMKQLFYAIVPGIVLVTSLLPQGNSALAQQIDKVDAEFAVQVYNKNAHGKNILNIQQDDGDRKSTRLNSSHVASSYAVFCLKKKS